MKKHKKYKLKWNLEDSDDMGLLINIIVSIACIPIGYFLLVVFLSL